MAESRAGGWAGFAYIVGLALALIAFGAIGVVSGEFWLPTYRMKRSVDGPFARLMGGIALIGGTALLIGMIFFLFKPDDARERQPNPSDVAPRKKGRSKAARRRQAEEEAAAEYLEPDPAAKRRSGGEDDPGPTR